MLPLAVKARWKSHIHFFMKVTMKKSIINIKLAKEPTFHSNHCKNTLDRHRFCNRTEYLKIFKTLFLSKSFGNQPRLVPFNRPICLVLNPIDPLAPYKMC